VIKIRENKTGGASYTHQRDDKCTYKPEKKITWKTKPEIEDNIKNDLEGIQYRGVDWIHLVEDRSEWHALVKEATNLRIP
jgi:hypothetical protein